uniref:Stabilin 1 n=1 Tax=Knipowitschia caucasica TaxID=637954 RepID=A0AAV2MM56_KNICA
MGGGGFGISGVLCTGGVGGALGGLMWGGPTGGGVLGSLGGGGRRGAGRGHHTPRRGGLFPPGVRGGSPGGVQPVSGWGRGVGGSISSTVWWGRLNVVCVGWGGVCGLDVESCLCVCGASGTLWINDVSRIVRSDYTAANGVIHHIDTLLTPYTLQGKAPVKAKTASGLLPVLELPIHRPFTMFWPSDQAVASLPLERQRWLTSPDHQEELMAIIKAHTIRNSMVMGISNPDKYQSSYRSMHGSVINYACDKSLVGNILLNGNAARVIERYLMFTDGMAYGIDQILEPPGLGAHCDDITNKTTYGRCGRCLNPPSCRLRHTDTGKVESCIAPSSRYRYRYTLDLDLSPFGRKGCKRVCHYPSWTQKCCKNHYGQECSACPGGVESPCGFHGNCDDGLKGSGKCNCERNFRGDSCDLCAADHFGANCTTCNCTEKGVCVDGKEGSGVCVCNSGWTGDRCQTDLGSIPEECRQCHKDAQCEPGSGCSCKPAFQGNGTFCEPLPPPDLCAEYNGGCHVHADCNQTGLLVNCTCHSGYQGDGFSCQPINRCTEEPNGGCSDFASCSFTGPNERNCDCLPGYVGNGVQCLEEVEPPVDRCLENNGDCDPVAQCKDLHYHTKTGGVFHLRSPQGKYQMNFSQAKKACEDEGGALASFKQMGDAQQLGMHLCAAGWIEGAKVGYPIRFPSAKLDQSSRYDAYCYRLTDVSCSCPGDFVGNGDFCNGVLADVLATNSNFSIFYRFLLDYSSSSQNGKNLVEFLSQRNTDVTLFVPHNDGFTFNKTLTGRDLEYHISTNHSRRSFSELKHHDVIVSKIGFNLTVTHGNDQDLSCCPGYYGRECYKCPGDVGSPCSNHGQCQDGHEGTGECRCFEGFHGTSCEDCEPGRYGNNCSKQCKCDHGKCADGLTGSGLCDCYKGWKGASCSIEIRDDACGGNCDQNANCITGPQGSAPVCVCVAGYKGNGTHCKELDLCQISNGGCSPFAVCTKVSAGERTCSCNKGYTGDGVVCVEIDGCLVNNGGCPLSADCIRTGPNSTACHCRAGFKGSGHFCYPVNPCREDNGGCSRFAYCSYLGQGQRNCTCRSSYIGDGFDCRGGVSTEITRQSENAFFRQMFTLSGVRNLYGDGPYTVFVPVEGSNNHTTVTQWMDNGRLTDMMQYHIVSCETLTFNDLKTTDQAIAQSGHTLRFSYKQTRRDIPAEFYGNITVLAPSVQSHFMFWHWQRKALHLLRAHILLGVYSVEDLDKLVGSKVPTLNPQTQWKVSRSSTGALTPALNEIPPDPPTLMDFLNKTSNFSLFRNYAMDSDTLKYHVIPGSLLFLDQIYDGLIASTFLGNPYQVQFHINDKNQTAVNGVSLDKSFIEIESGIILVLNQVLEVQRRRCGKPFREGLSGQCTDCDGPPRCLLDFQPVLSKFPSNMKSNCRYRKRVGPRTKSVPGCTIDCRHRRTDLSCCPGYYGRECYKCPGDVGSPCSNHGQCQDGHEGTGECRCFEGFHGTSCEDCEPGRYGNNCSKLQV